ncbi:MAG TPA: polysaccharide deacetylase family protein, partial [Puia sp.]
ILNINYRTKLKADELANCLEISFSDYLQQEKPYLLKDQVRHMIGKGFCFGGHSLDHPNYRFLSIEEQLAQTTDSSKMIHDWFSLDYSAFSFPHDDIFIHQHFFDELSKSKQFKIDILFGTQNQKAELRNRMFHRFNAERPDIPIENLVKGILLYHLKRREVERK